MICELSGAKIRTRAYRQLAQVSANPPRMDNPATIHPLEDAFSF